MAKFISLFAGVGGFDLGMEQAGHECVAQVEWDKNAAGVLKHRWPNVPLFCDVSKVSADDLPDADFITYGFPCQDLSVAGKREGLDGKRSGLFYEATRLIRELRTRGCGLRFAVAENVGGLFSADDGVAFARCIRELLDCGACETGWRLLDSQYFGVAQRRKRVFIVSDFGGESVDEILAITESLPGYPAPSREAGKGTAGDATKSVGEGGRGYRMTAFGEYQDDETASCMKSRDYKDATDLIAQEPKAYNVTMCDSNGTRKDRPDGGMYVNETDSANTLTTSEKDKLLIAQQEGIAFKPRSADGEPRITGNIKEVVSPTLNCMGGGQREPPVVSWNGDITPKASEDVSSGSGPKVMSFAPSDITRGFGQKPEVELSGTLKKNHNDNSPHVVVGSLDCDERGPNLQSACSGHYIPVQGGEGVGVAFHASQDPIHSEEHSPALGSNATIGVAFTASDRSNKAAWEGDISGTINCQMNSESSNLQMGVRENLTVRRLTPIECERLQGFPDNWTAEKMELTLEGNEWKATGKVVKQADGPRYKQMGNAITVNVGAWIGKQIGKVIL